MFWGHWVSSYHSAFSTGAVYKFWAKSFLGKVRAKELLQVSVLYFSLYDPFNVQKDFKKYFNVAKFIDFFHSWFVLLVLWLRNLFLPWDHKNILFYFLPKLLKSCFLICRSLIHLNMVWYRDLTYFFHVDKQLLQCCLLKVLISPLIWNSISVIYKFSCVCGPVSGLYSVFSCANIAFLLLSHTRVKSYYGDEVSDPSYVDLPLLDWPGILGSLLCLIHIRINLWTSKKTSLNFNRKTFLNCRKLTSLEISSTGPSILSIFPFI